MLTPSPNNPGDDVTAERKIKLVRLRVGVFGSGKPVGTERQPSRFVHVVDIDADLEAPEGVIAYCGAPFAPGTLAEVPWRTMEPHKGCRSFSSSPSGMYGYDRDKRRLVRPDEIRAPIVENAGRGDGMFEKAGASIRVTAHWSVNDPVVYVNHAADSVCVDLAISGPDENDVIAHVQLKNPLDALTAGHNLISAGLDLAETLGMDLDQVQAATPSVWWNRGHGKPDPDAARDDPPDS